MRRVKLNGDTFSLEDSKRLEQSDNLCDYCGYKECSLGLIVAKLKVNRFNARTAVLSCKSFIPVITFQDASGMVSDFNTFRLGRAWFSRVAVGVVVQLRKTDGADIGRATVTAVHGGVFTEMDKEFGIDNHIALQAACDGDAEFSLADVMKAVYGGHRFDPDGQVSVIYLKRIIDD